MIPKQSSWCFGDRTKHSNPQCLSPAYRNEPYIFEKYAWEENASINNIVCVNT